MTTSLQTRVKQLEGSGSGKCPECGFDGDWSKVRNVLAPRSGERGNRCCETCGRPTHIALTWDGFPEPAA